MPARIDARRGTSGMAAWRENNCNLGTEGKYRGLQHPAGRKFLWRVNPLASCRAPVHHHGVGKALRHVRLSGLYQQGWHITLDQRYKCGSCRGRRPAKASIHAVRRQVKQGIIAAISGLPTSRYQERLTSWLFFKFRFARRRLYRHTRQAELS